MPQTIRLSLAVAFLGLAASATAAAPPNGEDTLTAFQTIRLNNMQAFQLALGQRATASRYELRGVLPLADRLNMPKEELPPPPDFRFVSGVADSSFGVWVDGGARFSDLSGGSQANDIDSQSYSAFAGVDWRFPKSMANGIDGLRVGGALGFNRSGFNAGQSDASGDANSYMGGLYVSYALPRFYASTSGSFGYSQMNTRRTPVGGVQADGSFHGTQAGVAVEVGGLLGRPERFSLQPIASFSYNWVQQTGFAEDAGGGPGFQIAKTSINSLETRLGVVLARTFPFDSQLMGGGLDGEFGIEPEIRAFWLQEFGDRNRPIVATPITGGAAITANGATSLNAAFMLGTGYTMRFSKHALLQASYDARLESSRIDHIVNAGLLFSF